jgi:hypothetical protein
MRCSHPDLRAVIQPGGITLNTWHPGLITGGPALKALAELPPAIVLADLTIISDEDGREVIVCYVAPAAGTAVAQAELLKWAQRVGYRRVWFPDAVIDVPSGVESGEVSTTCGVCGLEWQDGGAGLWAFVAEYGFFPTSCPACGSCMPEWSYLVAAPPPRSMGLGAERGVTAADDCEHPAKPRMPRG